MKPQLTNNQLLSTFRLIENLEKFAQSGYGSLRDFAVLKHQMMPNTIIIKYQKEYSEGGNQVVEFKIATIDQKGEINFIHDKFKDVFEQSAFISLCQNFNIQDSNEYQLTT